MNNEDRDSDDSDINLFYLILLKRIEAIRITRSMTTGSKKSSATRKYQAIFKQLQDIRVFQHGDKYKDFISVELAGFTDKYLAARGRTGPSELHTSDAEAGPSKKLSGSRKAKLSGSRKAKHVATSAKSQSKSGAPSNSRRSKTPSSTPGPKGKGRQLSHEVTNSEDEG